MRDILRHDIAVFVLDPDAVLSFLCGSMIDSIYGLSVAQTNDYVAKDQFVAVSSGLLIAYSLGAIAGPNIAS